VSALQLALFFSHDQACSGKILKNRSQNTGKFSGAAAGKEKVFDVVDKAIAACTPKLGELAHHHGENVARWQKTKWKLRKHVILTLPFESRVLPVRFVNVHMMVARLQVDGEQQVLGWAEVGDHAD
jgi:hypothetical protein